MTATDYERPQRERTHQQEDPRAQANRDRAREHGNHIDALAELAAEGFGEAERETDAKTQYEDGLQVLRFLIGADLSARTLEIDNVLHDENGVFVKDKAVEYIDLLLAGVPSMQARQILVKRQPGRADRVRSRREAIAQARAVSANLHSMAEAPRVQPALPSGQPVQAREEQPALPQRVPPRPEPIAPPVPEVPHVDEDPAWSTMQAGQIALAGEARGVLKPETVQRLSDEGYGQRPKAAAPGMGPAAPARFAASAVRIGDTQPMRLEEVLGHLAMDDAGADEDPRPVVSGPFPETGRSGDASPDGDSGAGDDDES